MELLAVVASSAESSLASLAYPATGGGADFVTDCGLWERLSDSRRVDSRLTIRVHADGVVAAEAKHDRDRTAAGMAGKAKLARLRGNRGEYCQGSALPMIIHMLLLLRNQHSRQSLRHDDCNGAEEQSW